MVHPCSSRLAAVTMMIVGSSTYLAEVSAKVIISEIAPKGSRGVCEGNDWIELYNAGNDDVEGQATAVDLSDGYILYDDKGMDDPSTFTFSAFSSPENVLAPGAYLVLCHKLTTQKSTELEIPDPSSPQFGIGKGDTIILAKVTNDSPLGTNTSDYINTVDTISLLQSRNSQYQVLSKVGPLPSFDTATAADAFDITYALTTNTSTLPTDNNAALVYEYTSTPTPAQPSIWTPIKSLNEMAANHRSALMEQNAQGTAFFDMDDHGWPLADGGGMDTVLEMHVTMLPDDYDYMLQNTSLEVYRPFESLKLTQGPANDNRGNRVVVAEYNSPGQIRPKGQASLYMSQCLGTKTIPYQIDMDSTNTSQTLFGVEQFFLRHHMADNSYMRDWAYHRMLARFGLPHLRSRKMSLYINGDWSGFYTLMESPSQEYVFYRNFLMQQQQQTFSSSSFALYKFTNLGVYCGAYTSEQIHNATLRLDETSTPPYAFEHGEHRKPVPQLGIYNGDQCIASYLHDTEVRDKEDVVLAWLRRDKDCAKMRLEEGLVDLELASRGWKDEHKDDMEEFLHEHLDVVKSVCDPGCTNSKLKDAVDVTNFLRTLAFYAVTLSLDSPLVSGFNYYLANTGDGSGWKLQAYDFNYPNAGHTKCQQEVCDARLVHWDITRPTCAAFEDNMLFGPLLTDPDLHQQYLEYVREFTDTVYANATFIEEMTNHVNAIKKYASKDLFGTFGIYMHDELSVDAANWNTSRFPLLPTMRARAADIEDQLAALEDGSHKRGHTDDAAWEVCPDWQNEEPDTSKCEQGCQYEGCHMSRWGIASYCDELTGKCYHGDYDEQCQGIVDGEQYPGMANSRFNGGNVFCRFAAGYPVAASECPPLSEGIAGSGAKPSQSYGWRWAAFAAHIMVAVSMLVL